MSRSVMSTKRPFSTTPVQLIQLVIESRDIFYL